MNFALDKTQGGDGVLLGLQRPAHHPGGAAVLRSTTHVLAAGSLLAARLGAERRAGSCTSWSWDPPTRRLNLDSTYAAFVFQ
jgi:hypothetical protein